MCKVVVLYAILVIMGSKFGLYVAGHLVCWCMSGCLRGSWLGFSSKFLVSQSPGEGVSVPMQQHTAQICSSKSCRCCVSLVRAGRVGLMVSCLLLIA